jgi:simple sugar transport system ATP-binding protein
MPKPPRLALSGITKRYGATLANDGIDLAVMPGEIHALLGENGAGKSTLMKIVYGVAHPDAGTIRWEGDEVTIADPNAARALGIGMVFQHFSLFETLTVAENIALGLDSGETIAALSARIAEVAARYGLAVDPARHVHHLSVGERQRVEILRCLLQAPRLLIMDEPTSVLTPQEAEGLFAMLRRLAGEGCSVLYISHKLAEIRALCDAATVLRGGRVVGACDPQPPRPPKWPSSMVGRKLAAPIRRRPPATGRARPGSARPQPPSRRPLRHRPARHRPLARAGEILGIAGVAGQRPEGTPRRPHRRTHGARRCHHPPRRRPLRPPRRRRPPPSGPGRRARGAARPRCGGRTIAHRERPADRHRRRAGAQRASFASPPCAASLAV